MNNDNQGRSDKKMKRNEQVMVWAVWGLLITFLLIMIQKAFDNI